MAYQDHGWSLTAGIVADENGCLSWKVEAQDSSGTEYSLTFNNNSDPFEFIPTFAVDLDDMKKIFSVLETTLESMLSNAKAKWN